MVLFLKVFSEPTCEYVSLGSIREKQHDFVFRLYLLSSEVHAIQRISFHNKSLIISQPYK